MPKLLTARGPAMHPAINPQTKVKFVKNSSLRKLAHTEIKLCFYLVIPVAGQLKEVAVIANICGN